MKKYVSIRVLEANTLIEASRKVDDGEFIETHEWSDVILPIDVITVYGHKHDK